MWEWTIFNSDEIPKYNKFIDEIIALGFRWNESDKSICINIDLDDGDKNNVLIIFTDGWEVHFFKLSPDGLYTLNQASEIINLRFGSFEEVSKKVRKHLITQLEQYKKNLVKIRKNNIWKDFNV